MFLIWSFGGNKSSCVNKGEKRGVISASCRDKDTVAFTWSSISGQLVESSYTNICLYQHAHIRSVLTYYITGNYNYNCDLAVSNITV